MDLQQTVTPLLQLQLQRVVFFATGFDQIVKALGLFRCRQITDQIAVHLIVNGAPGRAGVFKRVQTFVEPTYQHRLGSFFQERNVDLNIMSLADTVQTANTLLQQVRVKRQIEHHQMAGELEVTALGADFGAEQHLRAAVLFTKPGRRAVAFDDRHPFVEHGSADTFALAQDLLQLQRGGRFGANHQHFLRAVSGQIAHQPFDTRIEVPPGAGIAFKFLINLFRIEHIARALFSTFARPHDAGDFNRGLVLCRQRQLDGVQLAFREAFHAVTGVTEQHAAGAVAVHQHGDQLLTRGFRVVAVAVGGVQQWLNILLANQLAQGVEFIVGQVLTSQQQGDRIGNRAVVLLLFDKHREIVETVRIEQAQTRKVAFQPQLLRRSGQQQDTRHAFGQLFDRHIFTAGRIFAPDQVVGLIDDHQIPLSIAQMLKALLAAAHEVQRADHQLFRFERIIGVVLGFGVALVVKQGEA
ncbi:hypothetical protein D3C72_805060 [compost metagenome]